MTKSEKILGCLYIPFHAAILPFIMVLVFVVFNIEISGPHQMLVYFTISFLLILLIMFKFLRASFSDFIDVFWRAVQAVILGYVMYRVLLWVAVLTLTQIMTDVNPNQQSVVADVYANFNVMIVVTVILAPIVEESMFRGALFGTIRQKSRVAAYIASILLFSVFHLWDNLVFNFSWDVLFMVVQYIPASIALTWCYDRSGTIWSPILLHSAINLVATLQITR